MTSRFAVGDVVTLKSGGPQLTVAITQEDGVCAVAGFDNDNRPITINVPDAALQRYGATPPPTMPVARPTSLDDLFKTAIPPGVTTDVLPETKAAAIEMVAHLLRTKEQQTIVTLYDLTYDGKPFGDVEIVVRKKV